MPENTPPSRDYPVGLAPQVNANTWPLTSDNLDQLGGNALVPLMAPNPIVYGVGFVASDNHNASVAKLLADPPEWLKPAASPMSAFVKVRKTYKALYWSEVLFSLTHAASDRPKLELCAIPDPSNSVNTVYAVRTWGGTNPATINYLGRFEWRFEFRAPELLNNQHPAPQGLCFLDANTLLFSCDENGTDATVLYRVDLTTGEYTGRAKSTVLKNLNSLALDPDGNVWASSWLGAGQPRRSRLDLEASFATGTITEAYVWDVTSSGSGSLAFATVGGVEYVILTEFAHASTPSAWVFLRSKMSAPATDADRVLRFVVGANLQGFAQRPSDGLLYASRSLDKIDTYDLAAILTAGIDATTPTPVTVRCGPAQRCEGLDFRPGDGRLWCGTEARTSARRDSWSHCAIWSTDLDSPGEWNSFLVDFADGFYQVRCNGRLMTKFAFTPTIPVEKLVLGASASTTFAAKARVLAFCTVKALAFSDVSFSAAQLASLEAL